MTASTSQLQMWPPSPKPRFFRERRTWLPIWLRRIR